MLDKSVPYIPFTMTREFDALPLPSYQLPENYRFVFYKPGDEQAWAVIETAVAEFDSTEKALNYFHSSFAPFSSELPHRMLFIENSTGKKVATFTAWRSNDTHKPRLHWLAVLPEEQGKGLAKALAIRVTELLYELHPNQKPYLTTQTWSHPAVRLYQKLGYEILQDENYPQITEILNNL
ncbi:GNAT family N-acetyltransferase [Enterococcus sp. AZ072]|uniref:GNAT family N-acetyltransferase n=1 Tax=unclassified Enterococcus TaxID=2608891 RepID=UPI003D285D77